MELMIFQFTLLLSLNGFHCFYSQNKLIKFSGGVLCSTTSLNKATTHTCTLRRAMKLNIPKITKANYQNMINAYKNKYT
jgi:hypothetical protein